MKALVLQQFNTPYALQEVDRPKAGHGQVLVRIKASGVNPLDLKIQAGQAGHAQAQLPAILGLDMAGVVESLGEGVRDVAGFGLAGIAPGDEVYGMIGGVGSVQGSLAEYAAVDVRLLARKPKHLSFREAAALPLITITAWEALIDKAKVGPGQTVLVHGGAGGVGHIAVQLALEKGASVFSTVKPADNALIESYGAVPIDYTRLSVGQYVEEYTQGEGFDIVLDTIGGATLDASFTAARRYTGHVVSILGWGTHALAPLSFRSGTYSGVFTLYPLLSGEGRDHQGRILEQAAELVDKGVLRPRVDPTAYDFTSVAAAYAALQMRQAKGKVVVEIGKQ